MNQKNLDKMIAKVIAIEEEDAKAAGALGYIARALVQATLPHSNVGGNEFKRINGLFKLTILADSDVGLPYGSIPRLLLAWISTEAVKTQNRHLILGKRLSEFMAELDLVPTGGRWGTITRLKDQMQRLFSSSISCSYTDGEQWAIKNVSPISSANLWWNPKQPSQATLFNSTLTLNEDFFNEVIKSPVPLDLRALKALKRSPLAIDIYCWLTYRVSYLRKKTRIPWPVLAMQFGSAYSHNEQGIRDFKRAFLRELRKVHMIYPSIRVESEQDGLLLLPSNSHIFNTVDKVLDNPVH